MAIDTVIEEKQKELETVFGLSSRAMKLSPELKSQLDELVKAGKSLPSDVYKDANGEYWSGGKSAVTDEGKLNKLALYQQYIDVDSISKEVEIIRKDVSIIKYCILFFTILAVISIIVGIISVIAMFV